MVATKAMMNYYIWLDFSPVCSRLISGAIAA